jgi:hypothetical protein
MSRSNLGFAYVNIRLIDQTNERTFSHIQSVLILSLDHRQMTTRHTKTEKRLVNDEHENIQHRKVMHAEKNEGISVAARALRVTSVKNVFFSFIVTTFFFVC